MEDYYYRKQVMEIFQCDENFLETLEEEDLVCSVEVESLEERVFPLDQVERIRIIRNLIQELEVNLPGVEVILTMRDNMILMQDQFQKILATLVEELKTRLSEQGSVPK
jgi:MerR family transcriptional regulator, heat shock protein HspR